MAKVKKQSAPSAKPAKPPEYGAVACAPDGGLYCVESSAGRSAKASVIVRHAAPGAGGEIVYEHAAKFQGLWVSPAGHVHAASKDGFHHTNESGSWTKTRVTKESFLAIGGFDDSFVLGAAYGGELFLRPNGVWAEVLIDGQKASPGWLSSFAGSSTRDMYAAGSEALLHFDGTAWKRLTNPDGGPKSVVVLAPDDVFVASALGLYRGNAARGFTRVIEQKLQHACIHAGTLYCCAYSGGIFRWTGSALEQVRDGDVSVWSLSGGPFVAATGMQPGIHTFDGTSWTETHSV